MKYLIRILVICLTASGAHQALGQTEPFVMGVIDHVDSKELSERRILNIYLPEGYNPKDTLRYPVVYLLDGSASEDFIHIAGLYQYDSFEWIRRVPKSIVVGIATVDRRRDFTFPTTIAGDALKYPTTGHSDKFIRFLGRELQPFIESRYKTSSSKTLIGESLGGLLAAEILYTAPTLFNRYIIVSPSLWWDNGSLLQRDAARLAQVPANTKVYVGVGKEGITDTPVPHVMEVDASVLAGIIEKAGHGHIAVYFDFLPEEDHATVMHQAVSNALKAWSPKRG